MRQMSLDGVMDMRSKVDESLIKSLPVWKNGEMSGNVKYKVKLYILLNLIEEKENGREWDISPLPSTKQYHTVKEDEHGILTCDCQRWRSKHLKCSHIYAVEILKKLNEEAEKRIDIEEV